MVLWVAPVAGCAVIVGDPHGNHVFPADAASGEAGLPADDSGPAGDGARGMDAAPLLDSASSPNDAVAPDSSSGGGDGSSSEAAPPATDGSPCRGTAGPPSVLIATEAGVSFCIDSTEVSNAEYATFLASGFTPPAASVPAACSGVATYTPASNWPSQYPRLPVIQVNWCQAYVYCLWAGKRLCGEIGGGPLPQPEYGNPSLSQWDHACSAGGALAYPYGNTFDVAACGGNRTTTLQNVGTPAQCVGGYPGIYNMTGNVWEWTDSCGSTSCYAMGGAFDGSQADNACTGTRSWATTSGAGNIGIRCCSDL